MAIDRRSFLRGLLAAPFIARAEWLMPVRSLPIVFMPGDLVRCRDGVVTGLPIMLCAEPVYRVGRDYVVVKPGFGDRPEWKVPASMVDLFHGLPGNRVNNPSMKHRLIQKPGSLGLAYPEDLKT